MTLYPTASSLSPPEGEVEKYINGSWQKICAEDRFKITQLDGQVWISLYNLLLREDCQRKYEFNNFNKNELLKVCLILKFDRLCVCQQVLRERFKLMNFHPDFQVTAVYYL